MSDPTHEQLRRRSWLIPLVYTSTTVVVGMTIPRMEHHLFPSLVSSMSAPAAMSVCSSIASGMIALTGIVFSLAFLMVQFSATAYSPRLVLWVARDPVVSHALGVFSSTFLYALTLLAWVDRGASGKVPLVSGWLVFVLLLVSIGMFVALIERVGLLQVNRMLVFTGDQGRKSIRELYPPRQEAPAVPEPNPFESLSPTQTVIHSGPPMVVQAVDAPSLVRQAQAAGALIEIVTVVGDTVLEHTPLIRVYSASQPLKEEPLKSAILLGDERTFEQDPKYALRILVDIAIKALSPAINDPTTAVQALDQIEDLLIRIGESRLHIGHYRDPEGKVRLVIHFPLWDDFLRLALDEIRYCGGNSVQVMRRMKALIENLKELLPAERRPALDTWDRRLQGTVERSFADAREKADASVPDRQGLGIGDQESAAPKPQPL
jgi:uncharacterized membrane protein